MAILAAMGHRKARRVIKARRMSVNDFGNKGKRFGLPNSRVIIHQPMGGVSGQATDIDIQAQEILRLRRRLNEILESHTGQSLEGIQRDTERDFIMAAAQAKEYGIIDEVIEKK